MSRDFEEKDSTHSLPERPNIEFERKRAKKLVRAARGTMRLAEAQQTIAREYGFANWSKLVRYYATWETHHHTGPHFESMRAEHYDQKVQWLMDEFNGRHALAEQPFDYHLYGALLATFVPRFYGLNDAEIFSSTLAVDEARLAIARQQRFSSWDLLQEFINSDDAKLRDNERPEVRAFEAIRKGDRPALHALIVEHPELLHAPSPDKRDQSILRSVLILRTREDSVQNRELWEWIIAMGGDMQATLNQSLLGHIKMQTSAVQFALELGADPLWMPANGISVLEHALLRYWNGEAAQLVANRVVPRKAFWIAAGLGDVSTMRKFLNAKGKPTDAVHRDRPDFLATRSFIPTRPDASDLDLLFEAFLVATLNSQGSSMDVLLQHGYPIDYSAWQMNPLQWAVANQIVSAAELLIARGADVDFERFTSYPSPRKYAAMHMKNMPNDPVSKRLYELCNR